MATPIENNTAALNALLDKANALPEAGSGSAYAVLYAPQELTAEQQTQARNNIGAASADTVSQLSKEIADLKSTGIIVVQSGDTLTIESVETENVEEVGSDG